LDELSEADELISMKSMMQHFIFSLDPEFEVIQHNVCIGNYPYEWHTQDWPTLLVLFWDYYHLINPEGILKCDSFHENLLLVRLIEWHSIRR
jgi:hypothetical protein